MLSVKVLTALFGVALTTTALWIATPTHDALPFAVPAAQPQQQPSPEEMQKMMEGAKKWTAPSPAHDKLKRFVGKWDVATTMMGQPAGKSKAEFTSVLGGRFVKQEYKGSMMGLPYEGFGLMGYDNFKQAYVQTWIDSMSTYKLDSQGKLDQGGNTMIFYGTLDEYLTGEIGKPVKYVYRFKDDDHFTIESHDLAIGETNTMVLEFQYSRAK